MRFNELMEDFNILSWNKNPNIGWWLDNNFIRLYHGTHIDNLDNIEKEGLRSSPVGHTVGWISLALTPSTAYGYANMSKMGGEVAWGIKNRDKTGKHATRGTPRSERAILVIDIPREFILKHMKRTGSTNYLTDRLNNEELYKNWNKSDIEYYDLTEIQLPSPISPKYIKGYMIRQ